MRLKSVIVQGDINTTLKYRLGAVEDIRRGKWEIAISSVSYYFTKYVDSVLCIETNYVQTNNLLESGEIFTAPMKLQVVRCSGRKGNTYVIGIRGRDWFEISHPEDCLELKFSSARPELPLPEGVYVVVSLLIRRVA